MPRLGVGNGFFVTIEHEGQGPLNVAWRPDGGRMLVYSDRPAEFGAETSGLFQGVPAAARIATGTSGGDTLHVPARSPGVYTIFFYNASQNSIGPSEASMVYFTIGHCP